LIELPENFAEDSHAVRGAGRNVTEVEETLETSGRFFSDSGTASIEAARSLLMAWEPQAIIDRAERALRIPGCRARSERNPMLTKLCLAYDPRLDVELRLNFYHREAYSHDSWHDHRWDFTSRILAGSVVHLISADNRGSAADCMGTTHAAGDVFYVGRHLFHSFVPEPGTVTFMARGPYRRATWYRTEVADSQTRSSEELSLQQTVLNDLELEEVINAVRNSVGVPQTGQTPKTFTDR
jgi:hypothetical protein